jgi:hypothetical protein
VPHKLSASLQEQVRARANYLCEYCHTDERWQYVRFTIDHITPLTAGGTDSPENLALACFHCNRRKSNKQTAVDPETGQSVTLFNPRQHQWSAHFLWSADGLRVLSQTSIGRATIELLQLNRERILYLRSADVEVERHPPADDPIQPAEPSTA